MKSQKNFIVIAFIIGVVFLISGFTKAVSFQYFGSIINNYITLYPDIIAIIVIVTELVLGVMLIFGFSLKTTSIISLFLIILFTLVYSYGLIFLDIHDCGCFGKVKFFNSSPLFLYIRNILLFAGLIYIYKISSNCKKNSLVPLPLYICTILIVAFAIFLCRPSTSSSSFNKMNISNEKIALKDNILDKFVEISPDSTYLIYLFSYDCPHCINSFGNLVQYDNKKFVDRIIGITKTNRDARTKFINFFNPDFEIIELPEEEFHKISDEYPVSYFIKEDSIKKMVKGEIPSAFFLSCD